MEYEKPHTATTFSSRKMTTTNRSHSLSFSANAVYDGVFASPAGTKSPMVDYGEIFRGSGPSPSSIPFLDVPELYGGKVKVDVRSSKLDYSSVFGGFGACDFSVTPKEVIIKPERKKTSRNEEKRNRRKSGDSSSDVHLCSEEKNLVSSPEMVRMKHSDVSYHQTSSRIENGTPDLGQVPTVVGSTQLVDNVESETPVASVEKKPCNVGVEEVKDSRKPRSKTEVDFEKIFTQNGCSTRENLKCKTDLDGEHRDVTPPVSLKRTLVCENGGSERSMGLKSGVSEMIQAEDSDSPSSPTYFDAETDESSAAAESSAALKKALEEAQVRMNIAKQMMERKKSGFLSSAKPKSCDEPKVEIKRDDKVEVKTEEIRDKNSQIPSEVANSSEQSCPNEGDQHAKKARKMWEVPEGLLISPSDQKLGEVDEQEVTKLEEEHAKRGRKHWELPGGIFKSVMNGKQSEPENLTPAKPDTDVKQPSAENPFYTFGQLGSKLKCVVVEAFTGSKVSQKDETQVTEKENSSLPQMVQGEESESQEMLADTPIMETHTREVEEAPQQTESKSETKIEEKSESETCVFTEGCSQKMEKGTEWQVKSACESEDEPKCGINDFQENPEPTYSFLDHEGEKEIHSFPQEMFIGPDDTKTYVKEVEDIPTTNESLSNTQLDEGVRTMVSFVPENNPEPGNKLEETGHKAPRRRRVWKTSEDVYNMIKAPERNNRPWQLETVETETIDRSFPVEGVRINDVSVETEGTSAQATDSGLQENWTVLKQMFRQMFQTADTTKGDDESYCLVEPENEHTDMHQKDEEESGEEAAETSYHQMTGTDVYEENDMETVAKAHGAYEKNSESEDLEPARETYFREEDGKVEVQEKASLVRELIGEELEAIGMASVQEGEDEPEVFEEAGWAQELSELEIKEDADSRAEMLEYDRSETDSTNSGKKFEQKQELADETKIDGSIDTDTSRSSFETRQGDSYNEEVGVEQDLSDHFHEKNSAASSTEEQDSDSIQSGWSVVEDEEKVKFYMEEILAGRDASKPEEIEETEDNNDETRTSLGEENNEDKAEEEQCQNEGTDRSNVEPAESSSCCLPKGDEKTDQDNGGEEGCRSSMEEEGDATSNASQNEAEQPLKKKDEAREKERERFMVERAIREARERALADAKERAGKAAVEKAKSGGGVPPRRETTSDVPRRTEKGSAEISSAEKASQQAKLRAERAAVERALSEARERALEKALSGKSSQTRSYGGSKSFSSSGERRGSSSSSGTENKSSTSSNQTGMSKGEPIQRCKARSERHQRTSEHAAEALAEKKLRDLKTQKEQAERNRLAEALDADVKRWSNGKENNLRALLSTLQYILGAESGWKPIPLTDLVSSASVRKAYRKATLYVHPDKLQQRGASTQQKYICEKVFDLLKEAWNKFGSDER